MKVFLFFLFFVLNLFSQEFTIGYGYQQFYTDDASYIHDGKTKDSKGYFNHIKDRVNLFSLTYTHKVIDQLDLGASFFYGKSETKRRSLDVFGLENEYANLPYYVFGASVSTSYSIYQLSTRITPIVGLHYGYLMFSNSSIHIGGKDVIATDYTHLYFDATIGFQYTVGTSIALVSSATIFNGSKDTIDIYKLSRSYSGFAISSLNFGVRFIL